VTPTRLSMDAGTFKLIRLSGQRYHCPFCKTEHTWEHEDAWVEGAAHAPDET
jgi:organic radical activating enzyme